MRAATVLAALTMFLASCTDADMAAPSAGEQTSPADTVQTDPLPDNPVRKRLHRLPRMTSPSEALAIDQGLVAAHTGRSLHDVRALDRISAPFGRIRTKLIRQRPGLFAGSALADPPRLYIKGEADGFVRRVIADADFEIKLIERMPYSYIELYDRSDRLADALSKLGYGNFVCGPNEKTGQLGASVQRVRGLPSTPAELRAALPGNLGQGADLHLSDKVVVRDFELSTKGREF